MNIASVVVMLFVVAAVWFAFHTLWQNQGRSCGQCRGCSSQSACCKKDHKS